MYTQTHVNDNDTDEKYIYFKVSVWHDVMGPLAPQSAPHTVKFQLKANQTMSDDTTV